MSRSDPYTLPHDLPVPVDDGAADHLTGALLPDRFLPSSRGAVNVRDFTVLYVYPRTGRPGRPMLLGWDAIPGARGCTPQSCAFRDHHGQLQSLGAQVFGLSTQDTRYQREVVKRLHLPFELLSDAAFELTDALGLPTFKVAGLTLLKRVTLVIHDGCIEKVFYPVFPPDSNAEEVIAWLATGRG